EQVMEARKAGKWDVIRNLRAVIRDSPLLGWGAPTKGIPNDGPSGKGVKSEAYLLVVGMGMVPFGLPR
ncbi:hypothetical protein KI387_025127, partial [Taxus chinensis]